MKVLLISTTALPISEMYGGVEKLVYDYAAELVRLGHEVSVAAPMRSTLPEGAHHIETVDTRTHQDWDSGAFYVYHPYLDGFDVVEDFSHNLYLGRTEPERPVINHIWDPITHPYERPTHNILALSQWQAIRFAKTYQRACRFEDIICVDTDRYHPVTHPVTERWLIVGKMSPDKGILHAIEVCRDLGEPLDIVGWRMPTDNPDYQYAVMKEHDPPHVVYYGNVTDDVKARLMQHARGILHFAEESHWLGGAEALACGTPFVSMERGAVKEVFDGTTGFLVYYKQQMLEAMRHIDAIDRKACRAFAVQKFSRKRVVKHLVKELYGLVASGEGW